MDRRVFCPVCPIRIKVGVFYEDMAMSNKNHSGRVYEYMARRVFCQVCSIRIIMGVFTKTLLCVFSVRLVRLNHCGRVL